MRSSFSEFEVRTVAEPGDLLGAAQVYLGVQAEVALRVTEALTIGGHRRDLADLEAEIIYEGPLTAPVAAGDPVGRLEVSLPDGRVWSTPVEAVESVERKGAFGRAGDALARMIRGG